MSLAPVVILGTVIGAFAYIAAVYYSIVLIGIPSLLVGVPVGLVAGLVWGCGRILNQWPAEHRPRLLWSPDAEVERAVVDTPTRFGALRPDRAWASYFVVQVRYDVAGCWKRLWGDARKVLDFGAEELTNRRILIAIVAFPLTIPVLVISFAVAGGMVAAAIAVTTVAAAGFVVYWTVSLVAIFVLRLIDSLWRIVVGSQASCPSDEYHVTALPVFRCPGPHSEGDKAENLDLHADIRPGRLGVLSHVCGCGQRLPTTVVRASRVLDAYCRQCPTPLPDRAGLAKDVRIGVFGATSAGKTHLLASGLVLLYRSAQDGRTPLSFRDDGNRRRFQELSDIVDQGRSTIQTEPVLPLALSLKVRQRLFPAYLHFFDAAGVALNDEEMNARHAYLDRTRTLIFVLDPFSLKQVRDRSSNELFERAAVARDDPETAYRATTGRLQRYGVRTRNQNLAIVVSKADLLAEVDDPPPGRTSDAVEQWLSANGMDVFIAGAKADFRQVRFFLSSSVDIDDGEPDAPFRWLLRTEKVVFK